MANGIYKERLKYVALGSVCKAPVQGYLILRGKKVEKHLTFSSSSHLLSPEHSV